MLTRKKINLFMDHFTYLKQEFKWRHCLPTCRSLNTFSWGKPPAHRPSSTEGWKQVAAADIQHFVQNIKRFYWIRSSHCAAIVLHTTDSQYLTYFHLFIPATFISTFVLNEPYWGFFFWLCACGRVHVSEPIRGNHQGFNVLEKCSKIYSQLRNI